MLHNLLDKKQKQEFLEKEIAVAKEAFCEKPFAEEQKRLKFLASVFLPVLNFFSIATGFSLLLILFAKSMHEWVAILLSVLLLTLLEFTKSELLRVSFVFFYKRKFALPYFIFSALLVALSVFLSVRGAEELHRALDKKESKVTTESTKKIDSLNRVFAEKEKALAKEKENFYNSVSYQNKINIYEETTQNQINFFAEKEKALAKEKARAFAKTEANYETKREAAQKESSFEISLWLGIAGVNEFLIILAVWFLVYYKFRTYQESTLVSSVDNTEELFNSFVRFLNIGSISELNSAVEQQKIGFQPTMFSQRNEQVGQHDNEETRKNAIKNDIKSGMRDYRTLMKRHKARIQLVKECFNELKTEEKDDTGKLF